ncbi:MAG: hypothetical protein GY719_05730 [bacterium]|nr:hypothetical protein [bacterium]
MRHHTTGLSIASLETTCSAGQLLRIGAVGTILLAATAFATPPALAENEPEPAELQTQIDDLTTEQMDQEEKIRLLVEQIHQLEIERGELILGRKVLQDRMRRLRAEQSALRIEAAGRPGEARHRRRLEELDVELAQLRQEKDELRLELESGLKALNLERNRLNAERATILQDPEYRELSNTERRATTLDLERSLLEIERQVRAGRRDLAARNLEIDRQTRAVSVERFHLVIAMEERRDRGDSVDQMRRGLSTLARAGARKEMEEVFDELLWEDQREVYDLRLQALDADDELRVSLYDRIQELNAHSRDLWQMRESQRRQADLEQLQDDLASQIETLEGTRATAADDAAVVFEEEIQKLRDAVRELAGAV